MKGNTSWIHNLNIIFRRRREYKKHLFLLFVVSVLAIISFFEGDEENKMLGYLFFSLSIPYSVFILVRGMIYEEFPYKPKPICKKDSVVKYYIWATYYVLVTIFLIVAFLNVVIWN